MTLAHNAHLRPHPGLAAQLLPAEGNLFERLLAKVLHLVRAFR